MALPWVRTLPFTELQHWAVEAETRGIWPQLRRDFFPLPEFPDSHLAQIRRDVERDWKPEAWLRVTVGQIPSRSWFEWHWQRGIEPDAHRPAIPRHIRQFVMARDGLVCQICFGEVEPDDIHLDHIKPWSKGGEHATANLRVTHSLCNMRKAARY